MLSEEMSDENDVWEDAEVFAVGSVGVVESAGEDDGPSFIIGVKEHLVRYLLSHDII